MKYCAVKITTYIIINVVYNMGVFSNKMSLKFLSPLPVEQVEKARTFESKNSSSTGKACVKYFHYNHYQTVGPILKNAVGCKPKKSHYTYTECTQSCDLQLYK